MDFPLLFSPPTSYRDCLPEAGCRVLFPNLSQNIILVIISQVAIAPVRPVDSAGYESGSNHRVIFMMPNVVCRWEGSGFGLDFAARVIVLVPPVETDVNLLQLTRLTEYKC